MPFQVTGIREIASKYGRIDEALRAELTPATLQAGEIVADQARANFGWSSYIPGTVEVSARFGMSTGGAEVRVPERGYPHAGEVHTYEGNGSGPTSFRHPTYGHGPDVAAMTRPSLGPAAREKRPEAVAIIAEAVHQAFSLR